MSQFHFAADPTFVFPNPYESGDGFEHCSSTTVNTFKPSQNRYGHGDLPDTPEKEKQRTGRFVTSSYSSQPQSRQKRAKR